MTRTLSFLVLFCLLSLGTHACGDAESSPEITPEAAATAVVEAWFAAVAAGDAEASYALGNAAFAEREREWGPSFSHSFFGGGTRVAAYEVQSAQAGDDGSMEVRVRATLARENGSEDGEGMTFTLAAQGDGWQITALN